MNPCPSCSPDVPVDCSCATDAVTAKGGTVSKMAGIEELRRAVAALNQCIEEFLIPYGRVAWTAEELLTIWHAWKNSDWDIYPDAWEPQQVAEALEGRSPSWREATEEDRESGLRVRPDGLIPVYQETAEST